MIGVEREYISLIKKKVKKKDVLQLVYIEKIVNLRNLIKTNLRNIISIKTNLPFYSRDAKY